MLTPCLAVDIYYAAVAPLVTTVAHVAALVLGAVLHYIVQRCSSIGVGHDSKQDWSKT